MLAEYNIISPWAAETSMLNTDLSSDLRCSYYWGVEGDTNSNIQDVTDFFVGGIDPIFTSTIANFDFDDETTFYNDPCNNNNTATSSTSSFLPHNSPSLGAESLHHIFTLSEAMNNGNTVLADLSDNINSLYDTYLTLDSPSSNKHINTTTTHNTSLSTSESDTAAAHRALISLEDDNTDLSQLETVHWSQVCETRSPQSKRKSEHCPVVTPRSKTRSSPSSSSKRHRNSTENRHRNSTEKRNRNSPTVTEQFDLSDHSLYCSSDQASNNSTGQGKRFSKMKWSRMANEEQLDTIEHLISYISTEMGLREQLEVIRIIKPTASIEPSATEFFIELDLLDDDKFETIRTVVENFQSAHPNSMECREGQIKYQPESPQSTPSNHSLPQTSDKYGDEFSPENQKMNKVKMEDHVKQRQKKEYRQLVKERKSGLFSKEQILSLETNECDDEDIDILS